LKDIHLFDSIHFSGTRQLFLLGALAIGAGVFTYSQKVMLTVGNDLFRLTPVAALVVVFSESLVLFLFASRVLEQWLLSHGLPAFPLVPVSSSQAVIGGIIGIGLAKRGHGIHYGILGKIALGWVATPIIAGVFSFVALFFVQNVFEQTVVAPKSPELSNISVEEKMSKETLRSSIVRSPGSHLLFEAKVLKTKARSTQLREMAMIEDIKQIVSGLDNKFQKGNDPFQIMTRLMEEVGELAAEVNHFEGLGVKMQKHGSPDKRKLAKELQDVIRCVVEIMLYYQVEGELNASIAASKNSLIRDGFL
jgi:phosphate/sulfate permease